MGVQRTMAKLTASVGMGTMEHVDESHPPDAMYSATLAYLRAGGRHLDCAEIYRSTAHVGRAIQDSGVPRSELHITSKLCGLPVNRGDYHGPEDFAAVRTRLQQHLQTLGVTYVDLLLVHWPGPPASPEDHPTEYLSVSHTEGLLGQPQRLAAACTWDYFDQHIDSAWGNMQRLRAEGLCRQIGVSNFNSHHLQRLSGGSEDHPSANQIYIDVTHQRKDLLQLMQQQQITPIAYRPLAFLPVVQMAADMGDGTHGALEQLQMSLSAASVQQVVIAWLVRCGCHVLAKTADEQRVKQNLMAAQLADSPNWPEQVLAEAEASEMVAMCGGSDECADIWMSMA